MSEKGEKGASLSLSLKCTECKANVANAATVDVPPDVEQFINPCPSCLADVRAPVRGRESRSHHTHLQAAKGKDPGHHRLVRPPVSRVQRSFPQAHSHLSQIVSPQQEDARRLGEHGELQRKITSKISSSCLPSLSLWQTRPTPAHLTSVQAEQILAIACENESMNAKRMRIGLEPITHAVPAPGSVVAAAAAAAAVAGTGTTSASNAANAVSCAAADAAGLTGVAAAALPFVSAVGFARSTPNSEHADAGFGGAAGIGGIGSAGGNSTGGLAGGAGSGGGGGGGGGAGSGGTGGMSSARSSPLALSSNASVGAASVTGMALANGAGASNGAGLLPSSSPYTTDFSSPSAASPFVAAAAAAAVAAGRAPSYPGYFPGVAGLGNGK